MQQAAQQAQQSAHTNTLRLLYDQRAVHAVSPGVHAVEQQHVPAVVQACGVLVGREKDDEMCAPCVVQRTNNCCCCFCCWMDGVAAALC